MAHPRKFRFGVTALTAETERDFREKVRTIEDLGYSTLFLADHFADTQLAPMVGVAVAAGASTTLRVGHLVLGNDYKHPVVTAKEAATLDLLSGGRLELGLGAGWMIADYEQLGLPYDSAGTRIARLAEAVDVVKQCFTGEAFDHHGEHYTINGYTGKPTPAQQPRPPLLMGGGGPKMLRLAGREADIVGINPNLRAGVIGADAVTSASRELTAQKVEWVREGAGERFDELELQIRYYVAAITDDPRGLAEMLAPGMGISPDDALTLGVVLAGSVDEVCDLLVQRREEWGVSYCVFGQDTFADFAPVVARLAGT